MHLLFSKLKVLFGHRKKTIHRYKNQKYLLYCQVFWIKERRI